MFLSQLQLVSEIRSISRTQVMVAGLPANDHDHRQFLTVTLLRYGLEADLLGLNDMSQCLYRRIIHDVRCVDLRCYAEDFKLLKLEYLVAYQQNSGEVPWHCFKRSVAGKVHYKWILSALAKFYDNPRSALQWLAFDERLLLTTNEDISKEISDYVRYEEDLSHRVYDSEVVGELSWILCEFLQNFSLGETAPDPCFGPGAVADLKGRQPQLRKAVQLVYDQATLDALCEYWDCTCDDLIVGKPGKASWRNKIIFRPKNALKHRIISAEPCWLSWLQQAIKRPLYDYVDRNPHMNTLFSKQSISRMLALKGSVDGSYATFDFSNASDAITTELVDQLFRHTYIHDALLLTRSREAELPDGTTLTLSKFAPMGSATCFVVMDMVFLSICELAIRQALGRPGTRDDYWVYGDDVIIRSEASDTFVHLCTSLGMTVNNDKSYWRPDTPHFYRESCGIEALDGRDITPIRYSRFQEPLWSEDPTSEQYISSLISLMNRLFVDKGYWETRSVAMELFKGSVAQCKDARKRAVAQSLWERFLRIDYSDYKQGFDGPLAVVVPDGTATNYRCNTRYVQSATSKDNAYQRLEVKASSRRKKLRNPHDAKQEETLLHLWYFKAGTDRPTRADSLDEPWTPWQEEPEPIAGSLLGAAMGIKTSSWGFDWTFGKP